MHGMEDVGVCVMVKGSPLETPTPEWWSTCLSAFFFSPVKRKGKMGVRERGGGGGGAREIILFWNLDSGARRPRSQSIWPVWGGAAGRGVLGGLIRRMLSHHPSRQAAENWLAPRRVEFTGGGGGGWGGENDAERCTRYLSQPLVCFRISAAN